MFDRESWVAQQESQERESRERLERGCKPRNTREACTAFVHGYEQNGRGSKPSPVYHNDYFTPGPPYGDKAGRVLISYATPIAFTTSDGAVYESQQSYSSSTSRHLSHLRSALIDAGYVMDARDCMLAPSGVYGGWLQKSRTAFARWVPRHEARMEAVRSGDDVWSDGSQVPFRSGLWQSDNGKWSIVPNGDNDGHDDIPYIVLGNGLWTAAHVYPDGSTVTTGSKPLPVYVRETAAALVACDDL